MAAEVNVYDVGSPSLHHIEVKWGKAAPRRVAPVRRLGFEGLHPAVRKAASDLFADGHYAQAIFEAYKALEVRVGQQSGLDLSGRKLMAAASHQSGQDEQEGLRLVFMGASQGIRNPKAHSPIVQRDAQRTLEYLALASLLFRRLDDAQEKNGS